MRVKYVLDPFSAYKYDQKADKVDFPISENMLFFDPSTIMGRTKKRTNKLINVERSDNVTSLGNLEFYFKGSTKQMNLNLLKMWGKYVIKKEQVCSLLRPVQGQDIQQEEQDVILQYVVDI